MRCGRVGILLACCVAGGCALDGETAALEARLRAYEQQVASLKRELSDAKQELVVARRESQHLRRRVSDSGEVVLASEQAATLFRATGLRINSLLTGGLDKNGQPGDEVLSLVLEPVDETGTLIRLPGRVTIELLDPAIAGDDKVIGTWDYSAAEVRELWHSGLFVSGFQFHLEWQTVPTHETLVIHARLETADDRTFDTTETVTIEPPP